MSKSKETRGSSGTESEPSQVSGGGMMFIAAALDMSWRLAAAVLVPIIGGHFLDEALNSTPWLTVVGFVIALIGVIAVMRYVVAESSRRIARLDSDRKERR